MSAKLIRIIALAGLTVLAGGTAATFTLDDAQAQAAAAGGPRGGGPNGGGNTGGGGGQRGSSGQKGDGKSGPEALPIMAFNPNCVVGATYACPPKLPPRIVVRKKKTEDSCGGYRLLRTNSDPLIYDPKLRCERQPN